MFCSHFPDPCHLVIVIKSRVTSQFPKPTVTITLENKIVLPHANTTAPNTSVGAMFAARRSLSLLHVGSRKKSRNISAFYIPLLRTCTIRLTPIDVRFHIDKPTFTEHHAHLNPLTGEQKNTKRHGKAQRQKRTTKKNNKEEQQRRTTKTKRQKRNDKETIRKNDTYERQPNKQCSVSAFQPHTTTQTTTTLPTHHWSMSMRISVARATVQRFVIKHHL